MKPRRSSSNAERTRRYRERQILGIQVVQIEIDQEAVEKLLAKRLITIDQMGDRVALRTAIERLIRMV